MNYLGHIFFSDKDPALMYANLFGDFVKGRNWKQYTNEIQKGIVLHRTIDSFIDTHNGVKELAHLLATDLPKVAPIAIDIYFDHFLVKHWEKFSDESLDIFLNRFYRYAFKVEDYNHPSFLKMVERLRSVQWLIHYGELEGVERACLSLSNRLSFQNALVYGRQVLVKQYDVIENAFFQFMDDAIPFFEAYHRDNK